MLLVSASTLLLTLILNPWFSHSAEAGSIEIPLLAQETHHDWLLTYTLNILLLKEGKEGKAFALHQGKRLKHPLGAAILPQQGGGEMPVTAWLPGPKELMPVYEKATPPACPAAVEKLWADLKGQIANRVWNILDAQEWEEGLRSCILLTALQNLAEGTLTPEEDTMLLRPLLDSNDPLLHVTYAALQGKWQRILEESGKFLEKEKREPQRLVLRAIYDVTQRIYSRLNSGQGRVALDSL